MFYRFVCFADLAGISENRFHYMYALHVYYFTSQAQRDYFGAHTYELLSNPGHYIHTNWTGHGGNVSSTSYNA